MIIPDYKAFRKAILRRAAPNQIQHSAKGTTWEDHKYIKRIDGTYYYPDSYEGGRHLPKNSSISGDKGKEAGNLPASKDSGNDTMAELELSETEQVGKIEDNFERDLLTGLIDMAFNPDDYSGEGSLEELLGFLDREYDPNDPDSEVDPIAVTIGEFLGIDIEDYGFSYDSDEDVQKAEKYREKMVEYGKQLLEKQKAAKEPTLTEPEAIEDSGSIKLSENDIKNLANEVIRGNFGNGKTRKELLGDNYQEVQDLVNKLMKSEKGSKKVSEVSKEEVSKGEEVMKKSVEKVTQASKGLNLEQVYQVYRKVK